jgi:hypothetical protein
MIDLGLIFKKCAILQTFANIKILKHSSSPPPFLQSIVEEPVLKTR